MFLKDLLHPQLLDDEPGAPGGTGDVDPPADTPPPDDDGSPPPTALRDEPKGDDVPPTWPDTWRDIMSGGDEKERARLERFGSPVDVYRSYREFESKRSSEGKRSAPPGADASPEEVAAWRKENGVPENAEGYYDAMGSDLVVGEADRPIVDDFLKVAHETNQAPEVTRKVLDWYFSKQQDVLAERESRDLERATFAQNELKAEWGSDYQHNVNRVANLLDMAGGDKEVKGALMDARGPDDVPIMSNPGVLRWLASLSRELNPTATWVPGGSGSMTLNTVNERIATIEKVMDTDRRTYDKNPAMQQELRDLYDKQAYLKSRS